MTKRLIKKLIKEEIRILDKFWENKQTRGIMVLVEPLAEDYKPSEVFRTVYTKYILQELRDFLNRVLNPDTYYVKTTKEGKNGF